MLEDEEEITMPTYEYLCTDCRKKFAVTMSFSEHGKKKPTCPKCGGRKVQQQFAGFFAKTSKKS